jgi:cyclophilin family peptidyl-prolyl cis-trans isomerase
MVTSPDFLSGFFVPDTLLTRRSNTMSQTNPTVTIETNHGAIVIELDAVNAPISTTNFLDYVKDGFFTDTIFHRVIPSFMIQGGGFTADMNQKAVKGQIKNEADNGLANVRGTLAMARTQVVDSATAQFFVNLIDNTFLNHTSKTPQGYGYAVFGKVTEGMDVVDAISGVATGNSGMHQDVPKEAVVITGATINE